MLLREVSSSSEMLKLYFIVILTLNRLAQGEADINPCHPKNTECLTNLFRGLHKQIMQSIPDASLPSLDALNLSNHNQSNPFQPQMTYFATLSNLQYSGLLNLNVSKFEVDLNNLRLILKIKFPLIILTADAVVSLNVLGINAKGEGPVRFEFYNLTVGLSLFGTETLENENRYLNWSEDLILVTFDRGVYKVESGFKRRQDFEKYIDTMGLEYPEILHSETKRLVKNTLANFMLVYLNCLHESYSIDTLYLPETK